MCDLRLYTNFVQLKATENSYFTSFSSFGVNSNISFWAGFPHNLETLTFICCRLTKEYFQVYILMLLQTSMAFGLQLEIVFLTSYIIHTFVQM